MPQGMNIAYLGAHSILEYDELRLLAGLGHDVFSVGAYIDPAHPGDDKRPALPDLPAHPDLAAVCTDQAQAKAWLPREVLDWADTIIVAAWPAEWIGGQWSRIRGHRVIWRTIGQSTPPTEEVMRRYHAEGLQIVRYSPRERIAFERLRCFAGEDAVIRFAKDPADWFGWTGEDAVIGNVTQNMAQRGIHCGYDQWQAITAGLPVRPAGPGSGAMRGGIGELGYDAMRAYLRSIRTYLYTGTQPASYTLGLIEAMMTGVPVVSIGPDGMALPDLFEGHEITGFGGYGHPETPIRTDAMRSFLGWVLTDQRVPYVNALGEDHRMRAIDLFGIDTIAPQWASFLGSAVPATPEAVLA